MTSRYWRKHFVNTSVTLSRSMVAYLKAFVACELLPWKPLGAIVDEAIYTHLVQTLQRERYAIQELEKSRNPHDRAMARERRARLNSVGKVPLPPERRDPTPRPPPKPKPTPALPGKQGNEDLDSNVVKPPTLATPTTVIGNTPEASTYNQGYLKRGVLLNQQEQDDGGGAR